VSLEHAAAGAVQVVPDHSACKEIWSGTGELIPVARNYIPEFTVLEMGEVSVGGVAESLERLYTDRRRQQELAQAGYALTQQEEYSWDSVARKFDDLFVSIAGSETS